MIAAPPVFPHLTVSDPQIRYLIPEISVSSRCETLVLAMVDPRERMSDCGTKHRTEL